MFLFFSINLMAYLLVVFSVVCYLFFSLTFYTLLILNNFIIRIFFCTDFFLDNSLMALGEKGETPLNSFLLTSILLMFKLLTECCSHSPMLFVPYMEPFLCMFYSILFLLVILSIHFISFAHFLVAFSIEELKKGYDPETSENYILKVTSFLTTCLSIRDFEPDIDQDLSEADKKKYFYFLFHFHFHFSLNILYFFFYSC